MVDLLLQFFCVDKLGECTRLGEVLTTLQMPISLPAWHQVAPDGHALSLVQDLQLVVQARFVRFAQAVQVVLPVEAHVQGLPTLLTDPL